MRSQLPNLLLASEQYKTVALCDLSLQALELCGTRFGIPKEGLFTDVSAMLASSLPIDLVLVLTADQYHAEHVIACAAAGKHVLIEKPMAQTLAECEAIEAARVKYGVVIFVGYMRRYATALERVKEAIKGKKIRYVRVRDIIGNNQYFTSQAGMHLRYFRDIPASASSDLSSRKLSNLKENLGDKWDSDPRNMHSWSLLGSLASHDLSAMRDLLGMPQKCLCSTRSNEDDGTSSWWWTAIFQYEGFKAYYEMGIDQVAVFDAHIEVYTNDSRVKIQYDTPYVKGLPIKLTIQSQAPNGDFEEKVIRPTYEDTYTLELQELYKVLIEGKEYKTTPLDARNDTILAKMVMDALVD
ncbi:hypothetical protein BCR39DRAFT_153929 [Naematelia encephala]|uniref:Gfo/Idh/MocA-like oxidoreductase N-terminal domain-containing protein n=1 Tax=Naematelia encephala TaxID=71784 RepID=A0A1Y2B5U5_9TREE|nr:hypothetical protein BCR39DRAFT_153929 [Naematelia encephala]